MSETSSSCSRILTEDIVDRDHPYLPAGYHPSNVLSRRLEALGVAVLDIILNVAPGDRPTVKSLTVEMLGL